MEIKRDNLVDNIIESNPCFNEYFGKVKIGIINGDYALCKEFKLVLEAYFQDYMSQLANRATLEKGKYIFRARNINLNSTGKFSEDSLNEILYSENNINFISFNGFNTKESGAPSKDICFVDGRCNHCFESALYAAEFEHTAIEEIAKIKNQFISVAKIKIIKDLDVALFSTELIRVSNSENKKEVWFKNLSSTISNFFNTIVDNQNRLGIYKITQYITDVIRELKIDGIMFTSTKSSYNVEYQRYGYNIVLFYKNSYEIEASKVVKIQNIKIDYEPVYKEK